MPSSPINFIWDKTKAARIEDSYEKLTVWRGADASGLDRTLPNETILKVLEDAGMPVINEAYDATYTGLLCSQRIVYGQSYDQANVLIRYETPSWTEQVYPTGYWYVKNKISLSSEQASVDAQNNPVFAYYDTVTHDGGGSSVTLTEHRKVVTYPKYVPFRQLSLRALINGTPVDAMLNAAGSLNSATWFGLPAAYWMCAGCESEPYERNPSQTKIEFTFISRITVPWYEVGYWEDERGQKPSDINASDVQTALSMPYSTSQYQVQSSTTLGQDAGVVIFGPYSLQNFGTIFAAPVGNTSGATYPSGYGVF